MKKGTSTSKKKTLTRRGAQRVEALSAARTQWLAWAQRCADAILAHARADFHRRADKRRGGGSVPTEWLTREPPQWVKARSAIRAGLKQLRAYDLRHGDFDPTLPLPLYFPAVPELDHTDRRAFTTARLVKYIPQLHAAREAVRACFSGRGGKAKPWERVHSALFVDEVVIFAREAADGRWMLWADCWVRYGLEALNGARPGSAAITGPRRLSDDVSKQLARARELRKAHPRLSVDKLAASIADELQKAGTPCGVDAVESTLNRYRADWSGDHK